MGFSDKHQIEVVAGISSRAPPLKPISTKAGGEDDDRARSTTPTARESKIPAKGVCPPPPRKRRPTPVCHFNGVREFFNPPDLESVFMCHAGRAN